MPVLILFAHPALHRSRANRRMAAAAAAVPGVTVHDLYAAYPTFSLDVAREQALLAAHDTVVFQHPLYWYSTPSILKEWQDLVLEYGWAYGPGGTALRGKRFLSAVTTAGAAEAYRREGFHGRTLRELLAPIDQTFRLCGMERLPPFATHGVPRLDEPGLEAAVASYRRLLRWLAEGRPTPAGVDALERINDDLDRWEG